MVVWESGKGGVLTSQRRTSEGGSIVMGSGTEQDGPASVPVSVSDHLSPLSKPNIIVMHKDYQNSNGIYLEPQLRQQFCPDVQN